MIYKFILFKFESRFKKQAKQRDFFLFYLSGTPKEKTFPPILLYGTRLSLSRNQHLMAAYVYTATAEKFGTAKAEAIAVLTFLTKFALNLIC